MNPQNQKIALVTGANSGIGRAIALGIASEYERVGLVGRDADRLNDSAAGVLAAGSAAIKFRGDLTEDDFVAEIARRIEQEAGGLDVLVHCAGQHQSGSFDSTPVDVLDELYRSNVRAPYVLTRAMLSLLENRRGQVVFINSSQGLRAGPLTGAYAATQHALKALADSLRHEVNEKGIRVLNIYPGRTATPKMEQIYAGAGAVYQPELLLQPEDIAAIVLAQLHMPVGAEMTHVEVRPAIKSY